jgi:uncharacterized protein
VESLEDNTTAANKPKNKTHPVQQPYWWRWQLIIPIAAMAVVSIGFSIHLLSDTQQRVVEQKSKATPQAWYTQQSTPKMVIDLTDSAVSYSEQQESSIGDSSHAYEEPLPQDLYEQAPVIATKSGISEIAKVIEVSETGDTRVVIPEESIPSYSSTAPLDVESTEEAQPEVPQLETTPESVENIAEEQIASLNTPETTATIEPKRVIDSLWQKHALPFAIPATAPMIAIVIDDMGVDRRRSQRATTLPGPLTLSYLTYANDITTQTRKARAAGHELMLHVPMQPGNADIDPGPNFLNASNSPEETLRKLRWGMGQFEGYVGLNNHMGSRFTQDKDGMRLVLNEVKSRGLLFLDSRTSGRSVADEIAHETGITFASRNVFLDHVDDRDTVRKQLAQTERLARRNGSAIAIGHPRDATLDILEEWLATLADKGFVLAPISAIVIRSHQNSMQEINTN